MSSYYLTGLVYNGLIDHSSMGCVMGYASGMLPFRAKNVFDVPGGGHSAGALEFVL